MPDGRFVSRSISISEQLGKVSLQADFLFGRMIPHLDREGRIVGYPKALKNLVCPLRDEITADDIEKALAELESIGLIQRYVADNASYVCFPKFTNHQRGARLDREAPSRIPAPPIADLLRSNSGVTPEQVRTNSAVSPEQVRSNSNEPESSGAKVKRSEVKRSEVKNREEPQPDAGASDATPTDPVPDSNPPPPTSWVARGVALHVARIGQIKHGRFGNLMKPVVDQFGEADSFRAFEAWIEHQVENEKPCSLAWFVAEAAVWVERSKDKIVVDDTGALNDAGRRVLAVGRR